jgi:hypothetical protein
VHLRGTGTFRPGLARGLRRAGPGIGDCERLERRSVPAPREEHELPLPPARHRRPRPRRAGARRGLRRAGVVRRAVHRLGLHPVRAGPRPGVATAARLRLRARRHARSERAPAGVR